MNQSCNQINYCYEGNNCNCENNECLERQCCKCGDFCRLIYFSNNNRCCRFVYQCSCGYCFEYICDKYNNCSYEQQCNYFDNKVDVIVCHKKESCNKKKNCFKSKNCFKQKKCNKNKAMKNCCCKYY